MKQKSDKDIIRDLFVKLKPIFFSDVYIYDWKYIIEGEDSDKRISGRYLCILKDKYVYALKVLFPNAKVLYIEDLVKIKDDMDQYYQEKNDKSLLYELIVKKRLQESEKNNWKKIIEECEGIDHIIYDLNHIYTIKTKRNDECIEVGKPLLPTITAKSIQELLFCINYDTERELYDINFKHNHSHFELFMKYYAVPMKE